MQAVWLHVVLTTGGTVLSFVTADNCEAFSPQRCQSPSDGWEENGEPHIPPLISDNEALQSVHWPKGNREVIA